MKIAYRYLGIIALAYSIASNSFAGQSISDDQFFVQKLKDCCIVSASMEKEFQKIMSDKTTPGTPVIGTADLPLFQAYPTLQNKLSHIALGDFPTPINHVEKAGNILGLKNLSIKRDDLSGALHNGQHLFGGNKVRKLEFLFADALQHHAKTVLSIGSAGSNCALAVTVYAHLLGLPSIVVMDGEPNAHVVRRNLLLQQLYRADLIEYQTSELFIEGIAQAFLRNKLLFGDFPYVIPVGASSPLGAVGFVNAAFELKKQIENHELEEPKYLYIAFGSMGTAAGIILGLKAAGLKTKVVPVCVTSGRKYNAKSLLNLVERINTLLHSLDETFPMFEFAEHEITVNHDFFGKAYGLFTQEGQAAGKLLQETENIILDGTYTGKAFAALVHDAKTGKILPDDVVLFWNTFCGDDFSDLTTQAGSYKKLPTCFYKYFETNVQELDCK